MVVSEKPTTTLVYAAAFAAAYFGLSTLGLSMQLDRVEASPMWLPSGLSLAAVLLFGRRFSVVVVVVVMVKMMSSGFPGPIAFGIGAVKAMQVILAVQLMHRPGRFSGTLETVHDVLAFVLAGAVAASAAGASASAGLLCVFGYAPWASFWSLAGTWWVGDALGVLVIVPIVLAFVTPPRWVVDAQAWAAGAALAAGLFAVGELAFGSFLTRSPLPLAYVLFPVVFWAAFRFETHGAAFASCFAAIHAALGTLAGRGPFARDSTSESLFLLAAFTAVMVVTNLILGAVIAEKRRAADELKRSQERYDLASSAGSAGVWDWDLASDAFYADPVLKNILGYRDDEIDNHIEAWRSLFHADDLALVRQASERHLNGESERFELTHRMRHRDGTIRWFLTRGEAQRDANGRPIRLTGTDVDITRRMLAEQALERGEHRMRAQLAELEHVYQTVPIGLALTDAEHRYIRVNERLASMTGRPAREHIGCTASEMMPKAAERVEPKLRRVFSTGEPELDEMELELPQWKGTALVGHYPLKNAEGNVQGVGIVIQDITPRKKAELLQARNNRVLELVAKGTRLSQVADSLAENAEAHTGCGCVIRVVEGSRLRIVSAPSLSHAQAETLDGIEIGPEAPTCGQAAYRRKAVVTPDVLSDPSWRPLAEAAAKHAIRAFWSVPILSSSDEILGTVALYTDEPRRPAQWELDTANDAAHLARVAIEHARAREALTQSESSLRRSHEQIQQLARRLIAAQEEERQRISRELHDGLNQELAALSFEIGKLRSGVAEDAQLEERLADLQARAARIIDEARRMSHRLHPSMLEHLGLVAALRAYCDEISHRGSLSVRFDAIHPPETMAPEIALCLFRVVQEGVTNAAKHAEPNTVQVTLRYTDRAALLTIADDGHGFDFANHASGGLGLVSMSERVRDIGGEFTVMSDATEGTRLEVRLPIPSRLKGPDNAPSPGALARG